MKICPNCQQTYDDDGLNFCLNDGGVLESAAGNEPPPTMIMNQARTTSPNFGNDFTQPMASDFSQPISPWQNPSPMQPQMQNSPYISPPMYSTGGDQTLPTISLVLGGLGIILSFCCYAGIPLGIAAAVTGFMGMNNATQNPQRYDGKNLAIGGLVTGGIGFLISAGLLLLFLIAR